MEAITLRQAGEIVKACIRRKRSVYLKGSPGIGKSAIVKQVAKEMNYGIKIFEGSSLDPTDVRGVMGYDTKTQRSFFSVSPLLPTEDDLAGKDGMIILIDELGSAMPSTKVALQPVFHPDDRRVGEHRLQDNVIPMATGNLLTDGSGATSDSEAMKDRVMMLNVMLPFQDWKEDFALARKFHPLVMSFLNEFKESKFNTFDKRNKSHAHKDFVTARTWEMISETLIDADENKMSDELVMHQISGYAGTGIASEVIAYKKWFRELPDIDKIFAGDNKVPKEPSILFALCSMIISRFVEKADKMGVQKAMDRVLEYSLGMDAEYGGLLVKDLYSYDMSSYRANIIKSKYWNDKIAPRYF